MENTTVDFNIPCCDDTAKFLDHVEEGTKDPESMFLKDLHITDTLEVGDVVIVGVRYFLNCETSWQEINRQGFIDAQLMKGLGNKAEFAERVEFAAKIGNPSLN